MDRARGAACEPAVSARRVRALAAAIGLFAGSSVAIIAVATRAPDLRVAPRPVEAEPEPPPRAAGAPPAPAPAPAPVAVASVPRRAAPAPVVARPGADVPWDEVPALPRWPALTNRLAASEPRIRECVAAAGAGSATAAVDGGRAGAYGRGVLMLHVETERDALRIADARVERQGAATDAAIACAQETLRGLVVPLPGTLAGSRMRVRYAVK